MKILLLIYGVSILISIVSLIGQKLFLESSRRSLVENAPWYSYILILFFAPIFAFLLPKKLFIGLKKQKRHAEYLKEQKEEEDKKEALKQEYKLAKSSLQNTKSEAYSLVARSLFNTNYKSKNLLNSLDKISTPINSRIEVVRIDPGHVNSAYNQFVIIHNDITYENIFEILKVEESCMGAWQAFVLKEYCWYYSRPVSFYSQKFIFSKEDLESEIKNLKEHDEIIKIASNIDFRPRVFEHEGSFFISYYYWANQNGLIHHYYQIKIEDNKLVDTLLFNSVCLYEYDDGTSSVIF